MGGKVAMIISGTGALVAIYLFLHNYKGTVSIISQLGKTYSGAVKTLQGNG